MARGVGLSLRPGDRTALIGPNGAGKTTLVNLIAGSLRPDAGTIRLDGRDITGLSEAARVRAGIARTFQVTTVFARLTPRETLRLAVQERRRRGLRLFARADRDAGTEAEVDALLGQMTLAAEADRPARVLAYGQRRLLDLACALALRPRVLILDEPAAGVPAGESHPIADAIGRLPADLAVLVIEHDMDLVFRLAGRIVVMAEGAVVAEGPPEAVAADARVRALYLGAARG